MENTLNEIEPRLHEIGAHLRAALAVQEIAVEWLEKCRSREMGTAQECGSACSIFYRYARETAFRAANVIEQSEKIMGLPMLH